MNNRWIKTRRSGLPAYKGLIIRAPEGLHEDMLAAVQKYMPGSGRILDVGAGSGAFSLRLNDHGYDVLGVDTSRAAWKASSIAFVESDANALPASLKEQFDAVCCQEVIEHVENPWHLLRQLKETLRPGGFVFLSFPNIESFASRLRFLATGQFVMFGRRELSIGHINPVSVFEMTVISESLGLSIRDILAAGYLPLMDFTSLHPRQWLWNLGRVVVFLIARGHKRGQAIILVLQSQTSSCHGW